MRCVPSDFAVVFKHARRRNLARLLAALAQHHGARGQTTGNEAAMCSGQIDEAPTDTRTHRQRNAAQHTTQEHKWQRATSRGAKHHGAAAIDRPETQDQDTLRQGFYSLGQIELDVGVHVNRARLFAEGRHDLLEVAQQQPVRARKQEAR